MKGGNRPEDSKSSDDTRRWSSCRCPSSSIQVHLNLLSTTTVVSAVDDDVPVGTAHWWNLTRKDYLTRKSCFPFDCRRQSGRPKKDLPIQTKRILAFLSILFCFSRHSQPDLWKSSDIPKRTQSQQISWKTHILNYFLGKLIKFRLINSQRTWTL